jgi:hypothetical protein
MLMDLFVCLQTTCIQHLLGTATASGRTGYLERAEDIVETMAVN